MRAYVLYAEHVKINRTAKSSKESIHHSQGRQKHHFDNNVFVCCISRYLLANTLASLLSVSLFPNSLV